MFDNPYESFLEQRMVWLLCSIFCRKGVFLLCGVVCVGWIEEYFDEML